MSRGFDGREIDDFRGPERDVNRSPESNSRAGWDTVRRLERIRDGLGDAQACGIADCQNRAIFPARNTVKKLDDLLWTKNWVTLYKKRRAAIARRMDFVASFLSLVK